MKLIKTLLLFLILTLFTQVGGIIYLLSKLIYRVIDAKPLNGYRESLRRITFHISIYLVFTLLIVPPIAGLFGRVRLPVFERNHLGPRTIWTVLLNRHYVRPQMKTVVLKISSEMGQRHPNIRINYFDANHPFLKGYPLFPHLSHNDGKKLDLGFIYMDKDGKDFSDKTPSVIGYGISEEPMNGEYNRPLECSRDSKNWMYNFMRNIYPQAAKNDYRFNKEINKELISKFAHESIISKVLLEPHLKVRMKLHSAKIKQVQCGSVRHDDHFHVQVY